MNNHDFVIITENEPMVAWLRDSLLDRGFSVLVGDLSDFNPNSINILFYYSKILSNAFLTQFLGSIIVNVHNSLLPKYRGLHAFSWAIEFGERDLGYTLHRVIPSVDSGENFSQTKIVLDSNCDVNCAFRFGFIAIKEWLPEALEELFHNRLPNKSTHSNEGKVSTRLFKRRTGPYVLAEPFDMERLRNALRASNPPYGRGLVFNKAEFAEKIYLLPFSPECRDWINAQNYTLFDEFVQCSDGKLKVNFIDLKSTVQVNS